ncbi:MAG: ABC transporter ATP-binding protein [Deltaproteobacteria bacterium]|nr:ABC transporter ATP-binding protein [Deltaproteobacteria bacterium]
MPQRPSPRLEVRGLSFRYGDHQALRAVSFAVGRGECLGLLGPNGAGKTTLLQVLTGMVGLQEGEILLEGERLRPAQGQFRAALGVVFQRPSLDGKLTARENLELGAELFAVPRAERRRRAQELLSFSDLAERADERIERFSEGMKRRLEIARALVHRPKLLLMDEPTQGLDEGAFQRVWARLHGLKRSEGLAIVLATHRADEADQCDRLAILHHGEMLALETPDALRSRVGGDLVVVEASRLEELAGILSERFAVAPQLDARSLWFEAPRAHELVPRLVEVLPAGRLRSIAVRRPTLADGFLKVTGAALEQSS